MIFYLLITLSAAGMFYANMQYKKKAVLWGRPVAIVLGVVTLMLAVLKIMSIIDQPNRIRERIVEREHKYFFATMQFLGNYLATNFPDYRILLISNPTTEKNSQHQETMLREFEKGLNNKLNILAHESPLKLDVDAVLNNDQSSAVEEVVFTSESFDLMQSLHPECNLVVSLIGLPRNYRQIKFWSMNPQERPKLVVVFGDIYELKNAIKMGYISAVITYNRAYRPNLEDTVPENIKEAFNKRFLLINKDNIDRISAEYPGLFMDDDSTE